MNSAPVKAARKRRGPLRHGSADKLFLAVNTLLLTFFLVLLIYPLLFVITASFSGGATVMSLSLWPKNITAIGYKAVFEYYFIWIGYRNSAIYMVAGTLISLAVTICCAYPLSRPTFRGGKYVMALCVVTMYFNGGLIPTYLLVRDLGLLDSFWALALPGSLSIYNMIVMRTYFQRQIPDELLEASQLDGCGDLRYLLQIVLPLSGPILAVISLYVAVWLWNSYFDALIYMTTRAKMPLPIFLREILVLNSMDNSSQTMIGNADSMMAIEKRREIMKYALIVVASAPVMAIYPFVQKYFVKGVMIGAIKG
ncbi:MAG: carbohydrate ABC transporter permease [Clostridiales bacterium]|nr:carbohydrate ABC transporter permease [Clostridiales bacterium]